MATALFAAEHGTLRQVCPPSEYLTRDWNKYQDTVVATGGVDTYICIFDIRNLKAKPQPVHSPGFEPLEASTREDQI